MSDDWKIYRLGQITDWFSGGTPRKNIDRYWNGDIPWISASSMSNNRISTSDMKITNEGLKSGSKLANKDDILLLVRGSILHQKIPVGIVMNEVSYNQDVKRIKVKDNLNPWFLLYWFIGNEKTLLRKVDVTGIGAGKFDTDFLQNYPISLPSLKEQKMIVDIVKSLDDKIYLNNQINQTLESIAQAMFKSWFIDFEPVRAKIAAKQEGKNSELAAMCAISGKSEAELEQMAEDDFAELQATAALFPDELVESELGEVPKGWAIGELKDLIDFNPKRTLKKDSLALYLDMKNVPTQGHLVDEVIWRNMSSGTKFINGDTLLARITPCLENGKTAYVDFLSNNEVGWGSTEFIVLRPRDPLPVSLGYFLARQDNFRALAIQSMTGTSGRQRANADNLANQLWLIYPKRLLIEFDKYSGKYLKKAKINGEQNRVLKSLRDTLLPKLLSGELDVSCVQDEVA